MRSRIVLGIFALVSVLGVLGGLWVAVVLVKALLRMLSAKTSVSQSPIDDDGDLDTDE